MDAASRFRRHILSALGIGAPLTLPLTLLVGCGPEQVDDSAGVTTNPSEGAEGADGADDLDTADLDTDEADTDDSDDSGPKPDILVPESECVGQWLPWEALVEYPDCAIDPTQAPCDTSLIVGCVPKIAATCAEQCPDGNCVGDFDDWYLCEPDKVWTELGPIVCGPYEADDQCCSIAEDRFCGEGRPFVAAGRVRTAPVFGGERRVDPQPDLGPALRDRLASRWIEIAQAEHASIASFAQFSAELLALGAPPDLVVESARAAADEQRHADQARRIAEHWAGRNLEFGPLDVSGCGVRSTASLAPALEAAIREGCIGETLSALELASLAENVDDPNLAEVLTAIADDELRHATLAWRFVQWVLERDPELRDRALAAFANAPVPRFADDLFADDPDTARALRRHGWQSSAERRRCWAEGRRTLIEPCAQALLG